MTARLPTHLEVAAILRRAEASGDFATVLRKGDADRGALILVVGSRGRPVACLERILDLDGHYRWQPTGPADSADPRKVAEFLEKRARFDEDFWALELDVAQPERFIAENGIEP